ncbi:MAG: DUF697 domain-containing protein [Saprospiraceae bacterium]|nr:DUF697 domain-containing protein [Saprospiraceae bacterium]
MSNKNNNDNLNERAESAVRNHVIWSMGAGFIPIPVADFVAVAAVQLDMIRTISNIYGVDFKETEGKALVTSLTGSGLSRLGANALIKLIPGFGSMLGGVSMSIVSGASTYALGQVFKKHFAVGGTFLDFDTDRFQRYYDEQFEKGKSVAKDIQKKKEEEGGVEEDPIEYEGEIGEKEKNNTKEETDSVIVRKLKELAELKEMGVIDDNEFAQMKARLIENYK